MPRSSPPCPAGLTPEEAADKPYIASMGIYVFKKDVLIKLLTEVCVCGGGDWGQVCVCVCVCVCGGGGRYVWGGGLGEAGMYVCVGGAQGRGRATPKKSDVKVGESENQNENCSFATMSDCRTQKMCDCR